MGDSEEESKATPHEENHGIDARDKPPGGAKNEDNPDPRESAGEEKKSPQEDL